MRFTEMRGVLIKPMTESDWPAVLSIYMEGLRTGNATFETSAPDWSQWDTNHLPVCRIVACSDSEVVGWAALSSISNRSVYAGVGEVSVYVARPARGRKVGAKLLRRLVEISERSGIWTLQAGIFPENLASIELHKHSGFRIVGLREKLGYLDGRWRDVLLLERRSTTTCV